MSVSGSDKATVRSEDVAHFMHEYKKRRKTQMARFFGVTMFTLITCRMAMKKWRRQRYAHTFTSSCSLRNPTTNLSHFIAPLSTFQTNYAGSPRPSTDRNRCAGGAYKFPHSDYGHDAGNIWHGHYRNMLELGRLIVPGAETALGKTCQQRTCGDKYVPR